MRLRDFPVLKAQRGMSECYPGHDFAAFFMSSFMLHPSADCTESEA